MIAFPRRGLTMSKTGDIVTIRMTDNPEDSNFEYMAHRRGDTQKDVFYIGAYMGSVVDNKLRSLSGKSPTVSKTWANSVTLCRANGATDGTGGGGYEVNAYHQITFIQCMYVLKYKNLNSQAMVGAGYTSGSSAKKTGNTNTWGMSKKNGEVSIATEQMKLFGIEDLWGNVDSWLVGMVLDFNSYWGTSYSNFNAPVWNTGNYGHNSSYGSGWNWATNYFSNAISLTGFFTGVFGSINGGFMPPRDKFTEGSATTYYCDDFSICYYNRSSYGGNYTSGTKAGIFCMVNSQGNDVNNNDVVFTTVGIRMMYL